MTALLIIAEAGVNHNGDVGRARDMIHAAVDAGADIVKFQAFRATDLVSAAAETAEYQDTATGIKSQRDMLDGLELAPDDFAALAEICQNLGIEFLCTPFEVSMTGTLIDLGMRRIKVASGELTNWPALGEFARFGVPVILSTGMATLEEVRQAVEILEGAGVEELTLLHCTSLYPAPVETVNLRAMITLREVFGCPVGYSDHTLGDHIAIAAVAMGASVIEKHFTLDRSLPGPDHQASMELSELKAMIVRLREIDIARGDGIKRPAPGEVDVARVARRSWHAARGLAEGAVLEAADIVLKRPADGCAPGLPPIGRRLAVARSADDPVADSHLCPQ